MKVNLRELFDIPKGVVTETQITEYLSSKYTNNKTVAYTKGNQYQQGVLRILLIYIYHKLKKQLHESYGDLPDMENYTIKVLIRDAMLLFSSMAEGNDIWSKYQHSIWLILHKHQRRIFGFIEINKDIFEKLYNGIATEGEIRSLIIEIRRFIKDIWNKDCDEYYWDFQALIDTTELYRN